MEKNPLSFDTTNITDTVHQASSFWSLVKDSNYNYLYQRLPAVDII